VTTGIIAAAGIPRRPRCTARLPRPNSQDDHGQLGRDRDDILEQRPRVEIVTLGTQMKSPGSMVFAVRP
jgi:hypothetical protein